MKGLASGLLRIVCICAPAADSAAPTTTAIRATGIRISQITTLIWCGHFRRSRSGRARTSRMRVARRPQAQIGDDGQGQNNGKRQEHELLALDEGAVDTAPRLARNGMRSGPRAYSLSVSETQ